MIFSLLRHSQLDAKLGAGEVHSESYWWYGERALKAVTTLRAKSGSRYGGFAGEQAAAVREPQ